MSTGESAGNDMSRYEAEGVGFTFVGVSQQRLKFVATF